MSKNSTKNATKPVVNAEVEALKAQLAEMQAQLATKPAKTPSVRKSSLRDIFGNRLNTRSSTINAFILAATKPLTAREIEDGVNASEQGQAYNALTGAEGIGAVRRHLDFLLERGAIVKGKIGEVEGYHVNPAHVAFTTHVCGISPAPVATKPTKPTKGKNKGK